MKAVYVQPTLAGPLRPGPLHTTMGKLTEAARKSEKRQTVRGKGQCTSTGKENQWKRHP